MLAPGSIGRPLMFATVALAATSAPPITTSLVLVAGADRWIPLLRRGSNLLVYSWSSEVAVLVTTNVLKSETGNEGRPPSVTRSATSLTPLLTPVRSFGLFPSSLTVTVGRVSVGFEWPAMGIALYLRI